MKIRTKTLSWALNGQLCSAKRWNAPELLRGEETVDRYQLVIHHGKNMAIQGIQQVDNIGKQMAIHGVATSSTIRYNTAAGSTIRYNTAAGSTCNTVQHRSWQYNTVQHRSWQYMQYGTTPQLAVQHGLHWESKSLQQLRLHDLGTAVLPRAQTWRGGYCSMRQPPTTN